MHLQQQNGKNYYKEKGFFVAKINARSGDGMKNISNVVKEACKEKDRAGQKAWYH